MYSKIKFKNFSMVIDKKLSDFQRDPSPVDKQKNSILIVYKATNLSVKCRQKLLFFFDS